VRMRKVICWAYLSLRLSFPWPRSSSPVQLRFEKLRLGTAETDCASVAPKPLLRRVDENAGALD
jgi:hypothetical protein